VSKRLDRFVVVEKIFVDTNKIKYLVEEGRSSHHSIVLLHIEKRDNKPHGPFKFNHTWLEDEDFINLVSQNWRKYDSSLEDSTMYQFAKNLKKVKKILT